MRECVRDHQKPTIPASRSHRIPGRLPNLARTAFWEGPGAGLCSNGRFLSRSGFSRGPKMVPWADLFRQKTKFSFRPGALFGDLQPTCFRDPFRSAPGHHFGRLWMDLGCILMDFGIIFDRFRIPVLHRSLQYCLRCRQYCLRCRQYCLRT